jgi:copper chaperone CopZ
MITVTIEGMSCENCVRHAREALQDLQGVTSVVVTLEDNKAEIEGEVSDAVISAVLAEEEYAATAIVRS